MRDKVPDVQPLTLAQALKKKLSRKQHSRMNAQRFKQKLRVHFKKDSISSLVSNEVVICVTLAIIALLQLLAGVLDVKGTFLQDKFNKDRELIFIEVLD